MRKAIPLLLMVSLTLAVFGSIQSKALAAVYKWKDDQGKVHFTDDKSKIPLKFRKQTQKMKGMARRPRKLPKNPKKARKKPPRGKSPPMQAVRPKANRKPPNPLRRIR